MLYFPARCLAWRRSTALILLAAFALVSARSVLAQNATDGGSAAPNGSYVDVKVVPPRTSDVQPTIPLGLVPLSDVEQQAGALAASQFDDILHQNPSPELPGDSTIAGQAGTLAASQIDEVFRQDPSAPSSWDSIPAPGLYAALSTLSAQQQCGIVHAICIEHPPKNPTVEYGVWCNRALLACALRELEGN